MNNFYSQPAILYSKFYTKNLGFGPQNPASFLDYTAKTEFCISNLYGILKPELHVHLPKLQQIKFKSSVI